MNRKPRISNSDEARRKQEPLQKGWEKVVGFQTRNVHISVMNIYRKSALTMVDGPFLNPVIGRRKRRFQG